jgi:hypothetical protein
MKSSRRVTSRRVAMSGSRDELPSVAKTVGDASIESRTRRCVASKTRAVNCAAIQDGHSALPDALASCGGPLSVSRDVRETTRKYQIFDGEPATRESE